MNRKKTICFKQHNNHKNSISEFFEMRNVAFYASRFITCKIVSFVIGAAFTESNWQFISICSCVIGG